jgi:hypothetical protein
VFVGEKFCGNFCSWEKERIYFISDSSFYEGKIVKKLSFFLGENVGTFALFLFLRQIVTTFILFAQFSRGFLPTNVERILGCLLSTSPYKYFKIPPFKYTTFKNLTI